MNNPTDQNSKIIERIRQLLAMAADQSSPHEAAIAAGRARKLMDIHQLSEIDLKDDKTGFGFRKSGQSYRYMPKWKGFLAVAVAKFNDCQCIMSHEYKTVNKSYSYRVMFQGHEVDTVVAAMMYEYLCDAIDSLCAKYIKELHYDRYPAKIGDPYKKAASLTVVSRLNAMQKDRELQTIAASSPPGPGTSLVIYKMQQVEAEFGKIDYKRSVVKYKDDHGVHAAAQRGRKDGETISLNTQIGTGDEDDGSGLKIEGS